jgi:pyoverdine/dityrosine biosynthesis protein Dit1
VVLVKSKEANVLGFKILINSDGHVVTEMSGIPEKDMHKAFKDDELELMRKIVLLTKPKLEKIHEFLESELSALNHVVN